MEKSENTSRGTLKLQLPVEIPFEVLQSYLRKTMTGEKIKVEKDTGKVINYAEILDLSLEKSREEGYDITIYLKFRTLTTFFRNREGEVKVDLTLYFDEEDQEITVADYRLKGNTEGWLMNRVLPTVINTFLHEKLKEKLKLNFRDKTSEAIINLNRKLQDKLQPITGVFLSGEISRFRLSDILIKKELFLLELEVEGNALAEITAITIPK